MFVLISSLADHIIPEAVDEPSLLQVYRGSLYIPFAHLPRLIPDKFFAVGWPR